MSHGEGNGPGTGWADDVHEVMKAEGIRHIATVPDGGLRALIDLCTSDPEQRVVTLTTEEEGVALLAGAWLGGDRGALLMQSSGVGNCLNMLTLPRICRIPCLMLVTMRGVWDEFNPWQAPMGRATRQLLEAVGVTVLSPRDPEGVGESFHAATRLSFRTRRSTAVLVGQHIVGSKDFHGRGGVQ